MAPQRGRTRHDGAAPGGRGSRQTLLRIAALQSQGGTIDPVSFVGTLKNTH